MSQKFRVLSKFRGNRLKIGQLSLSICPPQFLKSRIKAANVGRTTGHPGCDAAAHEQFIVEQSWQLADPRTWQGEALV